MELPKFKYHPDPLATGSIEASDTACVACGQARGYIYTGPVYAEEELIDCLCPWCIADGTAHAKFNAEFTDAAGMSGVGGQVTVPPSAVVEVTQRTPGFSGWQQERWWTHFGDAAAFLGRAGYAEGQQYGAAFLELLAEDTGLEGEELRDYMEALDKDGSPTAYVFRCLHCGQLGGYADCD